LDGSKGQALSLALFIRQILTQAIDAEQLRQPTASVPNPVAIG
jgi:hypothetical protein